MKPPPWQEAALGHSKGVQKALGVSVNLMHSLEVSIWSPFFASQWTQVSPVLQERRTGITP
jgi:hypothetical protein